MICDSSERSSGAWIRCSLAEVSFNNWFQEKGSHFDGFQEVTLFISLGHIPFAMNTWKLTGGFWKTIVPFLGESHVHGERLTLLGVAPFPVSSSSAGARMQIWHFFAMMMTKESLGRT